MTSAEYGPRSAEVTLEDALRLAHAHHQQGNLMVAERTYRDILAVVPNQFDALHHLAVVCYQRGNLDEALLYIEKAVSVNPEDYQSQNNYAILLNEFGRRDEALAVWEKAIALDPDSPAAHSNMGNALWLAGRHEEAEAACRRALEADKGYIDAYLNLGNALQGQGRLDEAIETWQRIVDKDPSYAKAYCNLSNAFLEKEEMQAAQIFAEKAVATAPNLPEAHNNLGSALRYLGYLAKAEESFRRAVSLKPDYLDAQTNLAITLLDRTKYDEGASVARYAVALAPKSSTAHQILGESLRQLGDFAAAEVECQKALSADPDNVYALLTLVDIFCAMERYDEAEDLLDDIMERDDLTPHARIRLSDMLYKRERSEEAIELVKGVINNNPGLPQAYVKLANIHYAAAQLDKAEAACNQALEVHPGYMVAENILADIKIIQGDIEEAREISRKILDREANFPSFYFTFARAHKFESEDDPYLQKMEKLRAENLNMEGAAALHFALGMAYDQLGQHEKAFDYYDQGNAFRRKVVYFSPDKQRFGYEQIQQAYNPEYLKSLEGKGYNSDLPVFIVGMPRSGTTLTEQIISSHRDVFGAGELTYMNKYEKLYRTRPDKMFEAGKGYIERLRKFDDKALRITDKLPGNFTHLGFITSALPDAKIIHCRRNPADVALSCYKQLFATGQYWSYSLEEIGHEYNNYLKIMEHWRRVLPEGRMLEIDYEDTVTTFEETARKLIDFIGLEWDDACLQPHKQRRAVRTASNTQVIKPVYQSSVHKWKRFEKQLKPFLDVVGRELCE